MTQKAKSQRLVSARKKIWIDLENSPHVPFFVPIIEELKRRGYAVVVTGRQCFQVADLAELYQLDCKLIGRHYGKHRLLKLSGMCYRSLQLCSTILQEKPDLALSHGSRSQLVSSFLLGIPHLLLLDYEYIKGLGLIRPDWIMVPNVIPSADVRFQTDRILKYPGIKEDVYVGRFKPDASIRARLRISSEDILAVVRPPANEAHYHNPKSDELYHAVIDFLGRKPNVKMALLPRNEKQEASARQMWQELIKAEKILIPDRVVDGRNLIWHSDLVISGGGTMNREAAALGVPVYSIFRGETGAVDRCLAQDGRLNLLESVEDIRTKIALSRRNPPSCPNHARSAALEVIVDTVVSIVESKSLLQSEEDRSWLATSPRS